jgi:hypothetical protein
MTRLIRTDDYEVSGARLEALAAKKRELEATIDEQVYAARAAGSTWQQIADVLGMSKAGVIMHWGRPGLKPQRRNQPKW